MEAGRSERRLVVVEVFGVVFAGTPFGGGLALVAAMVMVDQAGAVTVLHGVGEAVPRPVRVRTARSSHLPRRLAAPTRLYPFPTGLISWRITVGAL